ncbi:bifunctional nuclease family protein [Thermostilla marina]
MPVQMELSRVIISDLSDEQYIYLKEVDGDRAFPIVIGLYEATSIHRKVTGQAVLRPLPHDLVLSAIRALGGEPHDVLINELKDHTYHARLRIKQNGELIELDSRPSDAIAVAVRCEPPLPIFVAEEVLAEATGG